MGYVRGPSLIMLSSGRLEGDVLLALKMEEGSLEVDRGEEAHGPRVCTEHAAAVSRPPL